MGRIYNLILSITWAVLRVISGFNKKIGAFVSGRIETISDKKQLLNPIWIHCASVGEFEQGRPLLEAIKRDYPNQTILLSFFSPSGFEHLKDYELADAVVYAPFDTSRQVSTFLEHYSPKAIILIKYEFWKNLISQATKASIPIFSVSSIFREEQYFFKFYGKAFLSDLKKIQHFFVQNQESKELLLNSGITQSTITGDTRFDRVITIAENSMELDVFENFTGAHENCLVAGSTWLEDEKLLSSSFDKLGPEWKLIIAPHEVNLERINEVMAVFSKWEPIKLSNSLASEINEARVVIIDSIGILNRLYKLSDISYIGGGLGKGIHNILEAAVWGKPICFGPNHLKFAEAIELLDTGAAVSFTDQAEGELVLIGLQANSLLRTEKGSAALSYIYKNKGATSKVFSHLKIEGIFE